MVDEAHIQRPIPEVTDWSCKIAEDLVRCCQHEQHRNMMFKAFEVVNVICTGQ